MNLRQWAFVAAAPVALSLAATLAGCAGTVKGDCASLAGVGWTELKAVPAEGPDLLRRINLPESDQVVWFAQGDSKLFICDHAFNLVNPACGGSTGYEYDKVDGKWLSRGVSLPLCANPNEN